MNFRRPPFVLMLLLAIGVTGCQLHQDPFQSHFLALGPMRGPLLSHQDIHVVQRNGQDVYTVWKKKYPQAELLGRSDFVIKNTFHGDPLTQAKLVGANLVIYSQSTTRVDPPIKHPRNNSSRIHVSANPTVFSASRNERELASHFPSNHAFDRTMNRKTLERRDRILGSSNQSTSHSQDSETHRGTQRNGFLDARSLGNTDDKAKRPMYRSVINAMYLRLPEEKTEAGAEPTESHAP